MPTAEVGHQDWARLSAIFELKAPHNQLTAHPSSKQGDIASCCSAKTVCAFWKRGPIDKGRCTWVCPSGGVPSSDACLGRLDFFKNKVERCFQCTAASA